MTLHGLLMLAAILCGVDARVPSDWVNVEFENHWLRMPASLRPAAQQGSFIHGGHVWEDAHSKVVLSFGQWAEESFGEVEGERCRVRIGDADVFVISGPKRVLAWYARGEGKHEPVVSVSSDSEERFRSLAAIAFSLEITQ